ncbi:hydantoinase/oxoprolinase N-terminal domain-containing protein [Kordiimonas lipolytica]|uniref:Hydantoinase/oxoprolinase N-terminal domain-containing protein n=1 Tax=Kordiimonas lipolytica TaxID=1662421 RepID=A0ABV8UEL5_9PROT|nr:hydantoinase/oxoprolinase family protein [Kordiimonas lipolytica]
MRIGIDVGGTNTDAVLMDGNKVVSSIKSPTSENVSSGIVQSTRAVLDAAGIGVDQLESVMIGTTQFTNSFVERKNLTPVGVVRVGLPAAAGLPPLMDWPGDLKACLKDQIHMVHGGHQYDGRENVPLNEKELLLAIRDMRAARVPSVAVSSVFSPVNSAMELRVEEIILNEMPDVSLTLSHRIGKLGLIERENAAIMNASLAVFAKRVVTSFRQALQELNVKAPFFISQNDGTLMSAEMVEQYPVLTFASGPTNSMRGAAFLTGVEDALVADIGGTTTDIGMLRNGMPRESSVIVDVGGVRTNFRMPDIIALGVGGGSRVRVGEQVTIGPDSVAKNLLTQARVFGGGVLTATDIAVAAGYADVGNRANVADLKSVDVVACVARIHAAVAAGVERMKTSAAEVPLILVGGGAILISQDLPGVSEVIKPQHADVANAIGASIAEVGGEVDKVFSYSKIGREAALASAKHSAIEAAIGAGADPAQVRVIELDEIPLAYVPGGAVRIRVKATGKLAELGRPSSEGPKTVLNSGKTRETGGSHENV